MSSSTLTSMPRGSCCLRFACGERQVNKESDDAKIDCDIYDMEGIIIMHPAFVFLIFEISKNLFMIKYRSDRKLLLVKRERHIIINININANRGLIV